VPFLDHEFVELLATFPEHTKIRGKSSKLLLRHLVARRLGLPAASAVKMPFHIPLEHYLQDERLRQLVDDNLSASRINRRGILRYEYVRVLKERARGGDYLQAKKLFALVILELWFRAFVDGEQ
ncbi:MAG TPA: asparagine synthase-related protein, partial [Candidatus Limnocylindrales bacterium]|nr:asparagine synthase-related protein [Candidatus Limnocylindrales bacterium]